MDSDIQNKKNKVGYVYSGAGGAIGFLAGAASILDREYKASHIVGVSSGALVGIMHATGLQRKMEKKLFDLVDSDVVKKRNLKYAIRMATHVLGIRNPMIGLYDNNPLRELLKEMLLDSFVKIPYTSVSVDYYSGEVVYFKIPKGIVFSRNNIDMYVSKILSSTAIPVVFPPENINGRLYVDGGVETHTPIRPIKELLPDADSLCIITTAGKERSEVKEPKSDIEIAANMIGSLIGNVAERDFMEFKLKNEIAKCNDNYKFYPSITVKPVKKLSPTTRFHHKFIKEDYAHGVFQARMELDNA